MAVLAVQGPMMRTTENTELAKSSPTPALRLWHIALLATACFIAYGGALRHEFVWDDRPLILENEQVTDASHWREIFTKGFWSLGNGAGDPARRFYRPVVSLSYLSDRMAWGDDPTGFHLTNILLHVGCTILVYALAMEVAGVSMLPLTAALLFAALPVHVENVAWISGRTDLLCALFYFGTFWCFVRLHRRAEPAPWLTAATLLCAACALLAKEMAVSLFPMLLCYALMCERPGAGLRWARWPLFGVATLTVAYFLVRLTVLGTIAGDPQQEGLWDIAATAPTVFARYLGLLLGMLPPDPHHSEGWIELDGTFRPLPLTMAAICLGFLLVLLLACRRRHPCAFWLMWIAVALLPVMKIGSFADVLYADRLLYIPSFGFCMALVLLYDTSLRRRAPQAPGLHAAAAVVFGIYALLLLARTVNDTRHWHDEVSLFSHAAKSSPKSAYVLFNLGNALREAGDLPGALRAYERTVRVAPRHGPAFLNRGVTLLYMGRSKQAIESFRWAVRLRYDLHTTYYNMGNAYRRMQDIAGAESAFRKSLLVRKTYYAHNSLGECLLAAGRSEEARRQFEAALAMRKCPIVLNNLGIALAMLGEYEKSMDCRQQALGLNAVAEPEDRVPPAVLYANMAKTEALRERWMAVAAYAQRALQLMSKLQRASAEALDMMRLIQTANEKRAGATPPTSPPVSTNAAQ